MENTKQTATDPKTGITKRTVADPETGFEVEVKIETWLVEGVKKSLESDGNLNPSRTDVARKVVKLWAEWDPYVIIGDCVRDRAYLAAIYQIVTER